LRTRGITWAGLTSAGLTSAAIFGQSLALGTKLGRVPKQQKNTNGEQTSARPTGSGIGLMVPRVGRIDRVSICALMFIGDL